MRAEERIARLEAENARLREQISQLLGYVAENAALREQVSQLQEQLAELKGRLAKDSHNSSKPPSSDAPGRKPRSRRQLSEKPTGGQAGHPGHTLMQATKPDEVVRHRPVACDHCQQELSGVAGQVIACRQVHDLPEVRLVVREHQVEEVWCPLCQQSSWGSFPTWRHQPSMGRTCARWPSTCTSISWCPWRASANCSLTCMGVTCRREASSAGSS